MTPSRGDPLDPVDETPQTEMGLSKRVRSRLRSSLRSFLRSPSVQTRFSSMVVLPTSPQVPSSLKSSISPPPPPLPPPAMRRPQSMRVDDAPMCDSQIPPKTGSWLSVNEQIWFPKDPKSTTNSGLLSPADTATFKRSGQLKSSSTMALVTTHEK
ncbi:unnamed protein product [Echinostoma caproni]|uniref:CARMIL_C domain-containing protein n=1 Tax=Echinostoma caproni TaxID=27848 RepID=A0A183AG29_9TREM|nr:unnamed protein product [Echinostoma caproni]